MDDRDLPACLGTCDTVIGANVKPFAAVPVSDSDEVEVFTATFRSVVQLNGTELRAHVSQSALSKAEQDEYMAAINDRPRHPALDDTGQKADVMDNPDRLRAPKNWDKVRK